MHYNGNDAALLDLQLQQAASFLWYVIERILELSDRNICTRNWGIPTKRLRADGTAAAGMFLGKTSGVSVLHDN